MPNERRTCEQGACSYFSLDCFLGCVYSEFAGFGPVGGKVGDEQNERR